MYSAPNGAGFSVFLVGWNGICRAAARDFSSHIC
jgi:hypothetical protein